MSPLLRLSSLVLFLLAPTLARAAEPVTTGATPEARALLQLLYELSGKHILTGQHNYPAIKDRNTRFAADHIGKTPAVFSTDFGHAKAGDSDSYLARPDIVQECIRQHQLGALVTICWHAVPPTADEPVTFRALPGADPNALKSVQGKLLDAQFRDVLTPGTALHAKWTAQVDAIAVFLKQLQDARVPILWRPYHEMNGDWFWWGGRTGEYSTERLYRQIFDRLVNHHELKNLIWVWSMDRVSSPGMEHEKYFPGLEYVDVLGLDVYGNDFAQTYYESLERLAHGKPLALAEVGNVPAIEVLDRQPKWTFYVTWAGMVRNTSRKAYAALLRDPRVLNLEDPTYADFIRPLRAASDLPPLKLETAPADFSGAWEINEEESQFGRMGAAFAPVRLEIKQLGLDVSVKSTRVLEFADDEIVHEQIMLDATPAEWVFMGAPRTVRGRQVGDEIRLTSTSPSPWAPTAKLEIAETWKLQEGGRKLSLHRTADTPAGRQETLYVFDRR